MSLSDINRIVRNYTNTVTNAVNGPTSSDIFNTLSKDVNYAIDSADKDLGSIWNPLTSSLTRADGSDRTIDSSLDEYDISAEKNEENIRKQTDASNRVSEFMNPMGEFQDKQSAQNVRGAAGNAIDSSATEEAIASEIANNAIRRYNDAYDQSMNNANANIGLSTASQGMSQEMLENDIAPQQDLIQYQSDWETDKLQAASDIAKAKAQIAAGDKGFSGSLADFFGGLNFSKSSNA